MAKMLSRPSPLGTLPEVERVLGKAGRAETATDPAPLNMIETFIQLKPRAVWREGLTLEDLVQELDRLVDLPGVTSAWVMPIKRRIDMLAIGAGVGSEVIQRIAAPMVGGMITAPC